MEASRGEEFFESSLSYRKVGGAPLIRLKKALTSPRDVSTVLDIVGRPKSLGGLVVPLVEKCVEGFKNECLVRFLICLHPALPQIAFPLSRGGTDNPRGRIRFR